MELKLQFPDNVKDRIIKAFDKEGTLEEQVQAMILTSVGQTELNIEREAMEKKLGEERDQFLNSRAKIIAKELGID